MSHYAGFVEHGGGLGDDCLNLIWRHDAFDLHQYNTLRLIPRNFEWHTMSPLLNSPYVRDTYHVKLCPIDHYSRRVGSVESRNMFRHTFLFSAHAGAIRRAGASA